MNRIVFILSALFLSRLIASNVEVRVGGIDIPGSPFVTLASAHAALSYADKNQDWEVLIRPGLYNYSDGGWQYLVWNTFPDSAHHLIIASKDPDRPAVLNGNNQIDRALKIDGGYNISVENIVFDNFNLIVLQMNYCNHCTIRKCKFNNITDEAAEAAISMGFCRYCQISENIFYNLDSNHEMLHAFYLNPESEYNTINKNIVYYCSGAVAKVRGGSHYNHFDGNIIYGCGSISYFLSSETNIGNEVTNTIATILKGPDTPNTQSYQYYGFIRQFKSDNWDDYTYPDSVENNYNPLKPFYMPRIDHGNNIVTLDTALSVRIDAIIDQDSACIDFGSFPIYCAKVFYDDKSPIRMHFDRRGKNDAYIKKIILWDETIQPRRFDIDLQIYTLEGVRIKRGALANWTGELEKWIMKTGTVESSYDIIGSGQQVQIILDSGASNYQLELFDQSNQLINQHESEIICFLTENDRFTIKITGDNDKKFNLIIKPL